MGVGEEQDVRKDEREKVIADVLEILDIGTEDFTRYMKFMRVQIEALKGGEQE